MFEIKPAALVKNRSTVLYDWLTFLFTGSTTSFPKFEFKTWLTSNTLQTLDLKISE